jgi:hypothetical protein
MPPNIVDLYYGHKFKCGCGNIHILGPDIEVPRDLPMKKRFVAICPHDENMMNLLKIKGIVRNAVTRKRWNKNLNSKCSHESTNRLN